MSDGDNLEQAAPLGGPVVQRLGLHPRTGEFATAPGSYEQAIRIYNPIIDPGDSLRLEQFFTGYGEIRQPRFLFFPSNDIFDLHRSRLIHGLKRDGDIFSWGAHDEPLAGMSGQMMINLRGLQSEGWPESTSFFDAHHMLVTERVIVKAPLEYSLTTRPDIDPGKYFLEFYFTYYDGQKWRSSTKKIEFTVTTFFERNEKWVKALSVIGSAVVLVKAAETIWPYFKMLFP